MSDCLDVPLPGRILRLIKRRSKLGTCELTWETKPLPGEDTHLHKCKWFKGHISQHTCNCGCTTRADKRLKVGRNR